MSDSAPSSPELEPSLGSGPVTTTSSYDPPIPLARSSSQHHNSPPQEVQAVDDDLSEVPLHLDEAGPSHELDPAAGVDDSSPASVQTGSATQPIGIAASLNLNVDDTADVISSSVTSNQSITLPIEPSTPKPTPPAKVWGQSLPPLSRLSPSKLTSCLDLAGVCLVGFDHALGPTIEWGSTPELMSNSELQKQLPFLALPDGAHLREEDYSYFHLLLPSIAPGQTIFGVSCNRQIQADQLINKGKDVTRSTVQKAIVVLASKVSTCHIFVPSLIADSRASVACVSLRSRSLARCATSWASSPARSSRRRTSTTSPSCRTSPPAL